MLFVFLFTDNEIIARNKKRLKKTVIPDTTLVDSKEKSKSLLQHDVDYEAKGRIERNMQTNELLLYDQAQINYGKSTIEAGQIKINSKTKKIYASGIDSSGVISQKPVLKDGEMNVYPDSAIINYETKKALIYNYKFRQQEFNIKSAKAKKVTDSIYYLKNTVFTTSDYIEDPEYDFYVPKAKMIPNKHFISGFANMRVYQVPTPIMTPASFYSLSNKGNSGILIPTFGENQDRGFFLQNIGYYFLINDYLDLTIVGDWYSNGSFAVNNNANYIKRYLYKGSLSFNYESIITGNKDINDFTESTIYNVKWEHKQLEKANPTTDFSASVNFGSSTYYNESLNQANATSDNFLQNTINSSISWKKRFRTVPAATLSINVNHSQNTQTRIASVTFPSINFNVDRFYPFRSSSIKNGLLKNLNTSYNLVASNSVTIGDSLFFQPEMYDAMRQSMVHTIPITTNTKILKYFNLNLSANYQDIWGLKQVSKSYVNDGSGSYSIKTDTINKFGRFGTYNFSSSLSTSVYGLYSIGEKTKIQAIRHTMQPSLSYAYTPSFDKHYTTITNPSTSETTQYTKYELFSSTPSLNRSQTLGISVNNIFEAKIRKRDFLAEADTVNSEKKWKVIKREFFNINGSTSYNFEADSLNLSPINITSRLTLLANIPVNISMTLDPYKLDNNGNKINEFLGVSGGLVRLTALSISTSKSESLTLTISNKTFQKSYWQSRSKKMKEQARLMKKKMGIKKKTQSGEAGDTLMVDQVSDTLTIDQGLINNIAKDSLDRREPLDPYSYKPTWSLSFSQNFSFSSNTGTNGTSGGGLKLDVGTIGITGKAQLSPSLNVDLSSGYDIKNKGITYTTIKFYKDLLSWETYLTVTPIGDRKTWYFYIGIKAPVLKSVKYDKNKRNIQ